VPPGEGGDPAWVTFPYHPATHRRSIREQSVTELTTDATPEGDGSNDGPGTGASEVDIEAHRQQAVQDYQPLRGLYRDFAGSIESILKTCLVRNGVMIHSIEARAKSVESFETKALKLAEDGRKLKYPFPLTQITDLAAVRVITFMLSALNEVDRVIREQFEVVERTNKSQLLDDEGRLGYQSVHYIVSMEWNRKNLPEYERFKALVAEVQVRTILQHAWAEIEHDMGYKAEVSSIAIKRRFLSLAGMLEVADREFQAIYDTDEQMKAEARQSVEAGRLSEVEITGDALKAYLDSKLGPDGRMSAWSYGWTTRRLEELGFTTLQEVDAALEGINDDLVSRTLWGSRQGQLSRFDDAIMAALGEEWIRRQAHYGTHWREGTLTRLQKLQAAGVPVGRYRPQTPSGATS